MSKVFEVRIHTHTEAFGEDSWDREAETGRILRSIADAMYGGTVPDKAVLKDRNGQVVGGFRLIDQE